AVAAVFRPLHGDLARRNVSRQRHGAGRAGLLQRLGHRRANLSPHLFRHVHDRPLLNLPPKPMTASRTSLAASTDVTSDASCGGHTSTISRPTTRKGRSATSAWSSSPGLTPPGSGVP